uniref:Myotubularin phosphatase domain-containing protein n=1 Tax=Schistosoma haematobium TaxID=6185 RepID=A0A094ZIQ9_SCHHA
MSLVHRFGVWILRSGNLLTDINMNQLIDCTNHLSTTTTSNHQKKLYLKHIKLSFSDHLNELFKDKNIVKSTESTLQEYYIPLYEDYSNDWCTTTTTTHDCTFMTTSDHPTNNDNEEKAKSLEQNNFIPSSFITELYELNQHYDNWLIPKHNHIKQSWLQLKNLIQLPQIHTPNVEIFNEFTNTTTYNNNNNSMNDTTDYDSSVKLDHFAFQCSPHRSDWYDYLLSTNWLNLLLFTLKQATQLSQLIYQYSMKPVNGYNGTIILLSGPDSGRNWQPILMSLVQDYLVLLLDSALSRGGGTPPFTIEFSCSCEATRNVKTKSMTQEQIIEKSNYFYNIRAWRSFHNWNDILTDHGYQLLFNWLYFWQYNSDPVNNRSDYTKLIQTVNKSTQILIPILSPLYYPHFWIHAWYRWNRSIRLTNGGGYAFNAAYYRNLLGSTTTTTNNNNNKQNSFMIPRTNTTPYTGWLTDESIGNALNQIGYSISFDYFYKNLYEIANLWDNNEDFNTS